MSIRVCVCVLSRGAGKDGIFDVRTYRCLMGS